MRHRIKFAALKSHRLLRRYATPIGNMKLHLHRNAAKNRNMKNTQK